MYRLDSYKCHSVFRVKLDIRLVELLQEDFRVHIDCSKRIVETDLLRISEHLSGRQCMVSVS